MSLKEDITSLVSGEVFEDEATLKTYSRDASVFEIQPSLVVCPKNEADLTKLIKYAKTHKGVSLTARAAGTDMSGGPLTESVVLDFTKHFNHIGPIKPSSGVVQPGAFYRDFEKATLKRKRIMPSYPASKRLCAVGGMVANNAGGEKSLTYGQVGSYVSQLKVMLRDGHVYTIKPLSKRQLVAKMKQKDLEGRLYSRVFNLIEKHYAQIQAAKPAVTKNSTGYMLWNVWNREVFDLTQLFVGSQGTLGLITEVTFKLLPVKKHSRLVVITLHDLDNLGEIVNQILKFKPESFECYDDHTLKLALKYLKDMAKVAKSDNFLSFSSSFWPEFKTILLSGMPKLVLLASFMGDSEKEVKETSWHAHAVARRMGLQAMVTATKTEELKYWSIRRESFNLLRHKVPNRHAAPFIDDIIVNPEHLPQFLPELNQIMREYKLTYTLAGHIGNGNFHIFPLMDMKNPESHHIIPELSQKVFDLVFKYKGSMSGEHNDGLIRTPFLEQMYGQDMVKLFREVKKIFDPDNIFNPGKKVDVTLEYAKKHFLKD